MTKKKAKRLKVMNGFPGVAGSKKHNFTIFHPYEYTTFLECVFADNHKSLLDSNESGVDSFDSTRFGLKSCRIWSLIRWARDSDESMSDLL